LFGVCFGYLFYFAVYYKFLIFGAEAMNAIGLAAIVFLGLLSLYCFNLPKFLNREKTSKESSKDAEIEEAKVTAKLLSEGNFEPLPHLSVTENSTEFLLNKRKPTSGDL
jgi:hypothetical protein